MYRNVWQFVFSGAQYYDDAYFGESGTEDMEIWMDEVECTGTESRLDECPYTYHVDCNHDEDVGLKCQGP